MIWKSIGKLKNFFYIFFNTFKILMRVWNQDILAKDSFYRRLWSLTQKRCWREGGGGNYFFNPPERCGGGVVGILTFFWGKLRRNWFFTKLLCVKKCFKLNLFVSFLREGVKKNLKVADQSVTLWAPSPVRQKPFFINFRNA